MWLLIQYGWWLHSGRITVAAVAVAGAALTLTGFKFKKLIRVCNQFIQVTAATQWIAARKAQARLS